MMNYQPQHLSKSANDMHPKLLNLSKISIGSQGASSKQDFDDQRQKVDILQFPFFTIDGVTVNSHATATLVAPNIVMTTASNIYMKNQNLEADTITFYQGLSGRHHYSKNINIKKPFIYLEEYATGKTKEQQKQNNLAFLVLQQNIQPIVPILPLIVDYPQTDNLIGIYGYPSDKIANDFPSIFQYGMKGEYQITENNYITYSIKTFAGTGGSAIIVYEDQKPLGIIGVHVRYLAKLNKRQGTRLTTQKLQRINKIMKEKHNKQIQFSIYKKQQKQNQQAISNVQKQK